MSWFVYVVRVLPPANRNEVIRQLGVAGIPSRPYFAPIHLQPFYRERFGYRRGDFPMTEHLGDVCLALPFSAVMTEEQVDYVCQQLSAITSRVSSSSRIPVQGWREPTRTTRETLRVGRRPVPQASGISAKAPGQRNVQRG
jgi:hypothetical protein